MGVTPNFSLPYPELGDAPNGPSGLEALAQAIDSTLETQVTDLQSDIAASGGLLYGYRSTNVIGASTANGNFTTDASLSVNLTDPEGLYEIRGYIKYDAGSVSWMNHMWLLPAGANMHYAVTHMNSAGNGETLPRNGPDEVPSYSTGPGNVWAITFNGVVKLGGTAGLVQFCYANYNSAPGGDSAAQQAYPSIYTGSYVVAQQLAQ
jgi:hypothetical protein